MSAIHSRKDTKAISSYRDTKLAFLDGVRDGVPIALGYFAVSFSLGIQAGHIGMDAIQGFLLSATTMASAGQYAAMTVMAALGSYLEMFIIILVANARYMLMSASLSQRFPPNAPFHHRLFLALTVTDEIFGITINRKGLINPYYSYGAFAIACPAWSIGTALGIIAGDILPVIIVNALGVALFGMFLAIIMPAGKNNRIILGVVVVSFVLSLLSTMLPVISEWSDGNRVIVLTVAISSIAALLFPVPKQEEDD